MPGKHRADPPVHNAHVLSCLVFDRVGLPGKRHPEVAIGGVGRKQVRKLGFQGVEQGRELVEGGHGAILTPATLRRDNSPAAWGLTPGVLPA